MRCKLELRTGEQAELEIADNILMDASMLEYQGRYFLYSRLSNGCALFIEGLVPYSITETLAFKSEDKK